jgi:Tol biopolymer transport system component
MPVPHRRFVSREPQSFRSPMRFFTLATSLAVLSTLAGPFRDRGPRQQAALNRVDLLTVRGRIADAVNAPGSTRIYFLDAGDTIWLFDRAVRSRTWVTHLPGVQSLAVSRAGDRLAFGRQDEKGDSHIWTMPLDRSTGLAAGAANRVPQIKGASPAFSADGQRLAYVAFDSAGAQRIMVAPVDGGPERILAAVEAWPSVTPRMVTWCPDGRYIYFKAPVRGTWNWTHFRVPADGGSVERLAISGGLGGVGLSPDGTHLLLTDPQDRNRLIVADSIAQPLASADALRRSPLWSPSTDAVTAWSSNRAVLGTELQGDASLWMIPIAGGPPRLIDSTVDARQVAWSPDGHRFAAAALQGGRPVMLLFNADGTGRREFALADSVVGAYLVWSPDGDRIAFRTGRERGLQVLEVSTGNVGGLMLAHGSVDKFEWLRDGSGLRYISSPTPPRATRELRTLSLASVDRLVRPLLTANDSALATATFVDDSTVYLIHGTEAVLISVGTGSTRPMPAVRALLRGPVTGARMLAQLPMSLVLLDLTGSRVPRTLPMRCCVGENALAYPLLLPDSTHAVIATVDEQNQRRIQVLDLESGQTRDLVALNPLSAVPFAYARPFLSVSPDGGSLLYTEVRTVTSKLQEFDLSSMLKR